VPRGALPTVFPTLPERPARSAGSGPSIRADALKIVLASTSRYRRDLLGRLGLSFISANPGVDEAAQPGEPPQRMAERLARAKALAVASDHPEALIIGCDQVAVAAGRILGKPGSHENAVRQLGELSGRDVMFYTALCVHNSATGRTASRLVPYRVRFRQLDASAIQRYLEREQPYDCAGSAKSEGLGIALIERMEGEDPNALVGLPLIALVDLLAEHGVRVV
jgi:septum formation protein